MTTLNTKLTNKKEKGIALIFTLIMLSLLMILAMSFALDSMFSQKAAYNSASASSSGFMGQSQLNQVLLLINKGAAYFKNARIYSGHNSDGANDTTNYDQDMLKDHLSVAGILEDTDICFTTTPAADRVSWKYIKAADGRIIGRTSFVVIPDDKMPLDSLVSSTYDETLDAEPRIGKDVSEINVNAAIPSPTTAIINVFNWGKDKPVVSEGFTGGGYTGSWLSYDAIFADIEAVTTLTATQKGDIEKNLAIGSVKDIEAFWVDKNDDKIFDSDEYYSRFDLTRTDWNKESWEDDLDFIKKEILLLVDKDDASTVPTVGMQQWLATDTSSTKISGLPWIACFGYDATGSSIIGLSALGNFDSIKAQRGQIAANLKDYCDSDKNSSGDFVDTDGNPVIRPTSDVDPTLTSTTSWANTDPTYTGNEKTPYINKIAVQVEAYRYADTDTTSGITTFTAKVQARPYVELINIFSDAFSEIFLKQLSIKIEGYVKVHVSAAGMMENYDGIISLDQTYDVGTSWTATNGKGYNFLALTVSGYTDVPNGTTDSYFTSTSSTVEITVDVIEVIITKVILYNKDDNVGYDYVKKLDDGNETEIFDGTTATSSYCWYGWSVNDPRQNLNINDWIKGCVKGNEPADVLSVVAGATGPSYVGLSNALNENNGATSSENKNTTSPANTSGESYLDTETGINDPADGSLSTAYIRNAPMESPWELGCIQRGYMWQTLNLKLWKADKAIKPFTLGTSPVRYYLPGGGKYAEGDANILDQIKMTNEPEGPGKINLLSGNTTVLDALFRNVEIGCPLGTATGGSVITESTYRDLVKTKYLTTSESDMRTRASVVGELIPATATTDAAKEEIIGKIVNLTKIKEIGVDGFTIIILAQTIKDIGTASGISITKSSFDGTQTATRTCVLGTFDADTSDSDSDKHIYYDEMTGEQKIKVTGVISGGNVEITSFKYID